MRIKKQAFEFVCRPRNLNLRERQMSNGLHLFMLEYENFFHVIKIFKNILKNY